MRRDASPRSCGSCRRATWTAAITSASPRMRTVVTRRQSTCLCRSRPISHVICTWPSRAAGRSCWPGPRRRPIGTRATSVRLSPTTSSSIRRRKVQTILPSFVLPLRIRASLDRKPRASRYGSLRSRLTDRRIDCQITSRWNSQRFSPLKINFQIDI